MELVRTLVAFNTATDSDNKIHDDDVARRFGFTGGLVPGVDVYAYLTSAPVARWGRSWLERGSLSCRFGSPTYDGDRVAVCADAVETDGAIGVRLERSGDVLASGVAGLADAPPARPDADRWPAAAPPRPRPAATPEAFAAFGGALGATAFPLDAAAAEAYLDAVRADEAVYRSERIVHPGWILRAANDILVRNVVLGPWIHVGSTVQHHDVAYVDEPIEVRARIDQVREHKGHGFVELDVLVLAGDEHRAVARIAHTAIYAPRQVRDAT
jgi:acyl dehydratase